MIKAWPHIIRIKDVADVTYWNFLARLYIKLLVFFGYLQRNAYLSFSRDDHKIIVDDFYTKEITSQVDTRLFHLQGKQQIKLFKILQHNYNNTKLLSERIQELNYFAQENTIYIDDMIIFMTLFTNNELYLSEIKSVLQICDRYGTKELLTIEYLRHLRRIRNLCRTMLLTKTKKKNK